MEGIIKAVCISEKRGTVKKNINEVNVIKDFGLEGEMPMQENGIVRLVF